MRINNNLMALNAHRYMSQANQKQSKSLEKLSSGLAINSAADNAAGLAISEKMRAQINGLDQAQANAQDGISMIQTAEGALQETENILQRMRELAVQSANDTNTTEDRGEIQKEIDQLASEITRISESTEFNTKKLLDGSLTGKLHIGANEGQDLSVAIKAMDAEALEVSGFKAQDLTGTGLNLTSLDGEAVTVAFDAAPDATETEPVAEAISFDEETNTLTITLGRDGSDTSAVGDINSTNNSLAELINGSGAKVVAGVKSGEAGDATIADTTAGSSVALSTWEAGGGINVSSQKAASEAITTLNDAINAVSAERANLGSIQNRLDHTINNLSTTAENMTASESRIRDVDMAKEMMEYTKLGILQQASQAMLAQANVAPQGVLQLLQ